MVRITEDLVRKRSEHNEGEIFSLEELTLHQQDIEKIEFLNNNCRKLKILYLQNNLIPRIENINRLKDLEYLNLALNNIETIENLEGCESLRKLDLTVNFIGDLTSVENLINLEHLEELYLLGNPCTDYAGYRDFVIATLPQLKILDGEEIKKTERIKAFQNVSKHFKTIMKSQNRYYEKRAKEKVEAQERRQLLGKKLEENKDDIDEVAKEFWNEKSPYTPESRIETYEFIRLQDELKSTKKVSDTGNVKQRRTVFFAENGRPYNINEPKIDFQFYEEGSDEHGQCFVLDLAVYKNMDTSLIDCDVQANYVRVTLRNKVFQMALSDEVHPDMSTVQRSRVTGHLLVKMPKVKFSSMVEHSIVKSKCATDLRGKRTTNIGVGSKEGARNSNYLEVGDCKPAVDWKNIASGEKSQFRRDTEAKKKHAVPSKARENSPGFVDNPRVPPLE